MALTLHSVKKEPVETYLDYLRAAQQIASQNAIGDSQVAEEFAAAVGEIGSAISTMRGAIRTDRDVAEEDGMPRRRVGAQAVQVMQ